MSNLNTLIARMIEYEDGCVERVNHFLKVFAFAKTIAEGEGLDRETQDILEAAAVTHDVGIRVCFEKYGSRSWRARRSPKSCCRPAAMRRPRARASAT